MVAASINPTLNRDVLAELPDKVAIQQTLYLFSIAVDTHDLSLLSSIFASDACANFATLAGTVCGLSAIETGLAEFLNGTLSHHDQSATVIDVDPHSGTANSSIYLQGTFFGRGVLQGQAITTYGRYVDSLVRTSNGWLITKRFLNVTVCFVPSPSASSTSDIMCAKSSELKAQIGNAAVLEAY
ncbi:MAG: hypothetical protein M1818_005028 [Claussenomyces sp. TS43310]|nr:MAG: hypothetical protein M1818_005028 [Claussenomyces sp. TS43310]